MSNLTLADAVQQYADLPASVGLPSNSSQDFDSTGNVVKFDKGARISRIADAAQELVETERQNRKGRRAKVRDDGKSRLDISEAAQLLVQRQPKKIEGRLTRSQGVDELLGRQPSQSKGGRLTSHEEAARLLIGAENAVATAAGTAQPTFTAPASTYEIEATNAALDLQRTGSALAELERQLWDFVQACGQAFPEVIHDRNAHLKFDPHRAILWVSAQAKSDQFTEMAGRINAAHLYAWNRVVEIENRQFSAQNPDLDDGDADRMAAILLSIMSQEEAVALVGSPMAVSATDPRVRQILEIAAGSEDGEAMLATLRDAGFTEDDIAAIANGRAQASLMDHRVRSVLLRASRNVEFAEAAA